MKDSFHFPLHFEALLTDYVTLHLKYKNFKKKDKQYNDRKLWI